MKSSRAIAVAGTLLLALSGCWGSGKGSGTAVNPEPEPVATGALQASIRSFQVPDNTGKAIVTFTLRDENGNPLDPAAMLAADSGNRLRFFLARIRSEGPFAGSYENFLKSSSDNTQPSYDVSRPSASQFATVSPGTYTYTFKTDLDNAALTLGGITYDRDDDRTHTVAIQAVRNVLTPTGKSFQQAANPYFHFRPDGRAVAVTREIVATSNCNDCHGTLALHGGGRREIALCILCHYPGIVAEGVVPIDMMTMAHKIHMGYKLPSRLTTSRPSAVAGGKYTIGSTSYDTVGYPSFSAESKVTKTPADCSKCHRAGKDMAGRAFGKDAARYAQSPTWRKCTSCHDTLSFNGSKSIVVYDNVTARTVTNDNVIMHDNMARSASNPTGIIDVTGAQADNAAKCAGCHDVPLVTDNTAAEYNYGGVKASHTIFEKSSLNKGVNFALLSVDNAVKGGRPVVRFRFTFDNGTAINPNVGGGSGTSAYGSGFSFKMGLMPAGIPDFLNRGMNSFGQPFSKTIRGAATADNTGDGSYRVTFDNAVPASAPANSVGVISVDGAYTFNVTTAPSVRRGTVWVAKVPSKAGLYFFDVTTGLEVSDPARTRRVSVDTEKCKACHGAGLGFSGHGTSRSSTLQCVVCHNPNGVPAEDVTSPINFKDMIHLAHTGEEMDNSKKTYMEERFSEMRYPRDRRDCLACHVSTAAVAFPLPAGVLGTTTNVGADNVSDSDNLRLGPMSASCLSCHTDVAFSVPHAANQTTGTTELCLQCHTSGLLFGPDYAHEPVM